MASKRPDSAPRSDGNLPASGRGRAGRQSAGRRDTARAVARAGTGGSAGGGRGSLLIWSIGFVAVAVVVVILALAVQPKGGSASGGPVEPNVGTPSNITVSGRTLGSPSAPVTVDLYGDFRCSACYKFTVGGTEKSLVDDYISTGKAKLVWHDYLTIDRLGGGTASRDAANAAWCAADQGKFWVMHDWLYANDGAGSEDPAAFTPTKLSDIGKAAGLDMSAYQPCLDQGKHNSEIAAEDAATPKQVGGTPTVFVNGVYVGTAGYIPTYDQIKAAIDAAIAAPAASASPAASGSTAP